MIAHIAAIGARVTVAMTFPQGVPAFPHLDRPICQRAGSRFELGTATLDGRSRLSAC